MVGRRAIASLSLLALGSAAVAVPLMRSALASAERRVLSDVRLEESPGAPAVPARGAPPGWLAHVVGGGNRVFVHERRAAFVLEADETLHPQIPASGLSASYDGLLGVPTKGRYRFGVEVSGGSAKIQVGVPGEPPEKGLVLESASALVWSGTIALERGEVPIRIDFVREGSSACSLDVLWSLENTKTAGFPPEPIPSIAVRLTERGARLAQAEQLSFTGRLLLEQKGCTNCHAPHETARATLSLRSGPELDHAGARISRDWIERFLLAPSEVKPAADMPDLLGTSEARSAEARALAHFVVSLGSETAEDSATPSDAASIARGRRLYHARGCVACHGPLASPAEVHGDPILEREIPEFEAPAPFGDLAGKWRPSALARFLAEPTRVHEDGRMPSLELGRDEARLIAAFLVERFGAAELSPIDPVEVDTGRELFAARGCGACHSVRGLSSTAPRAPRLDRIAGVAQRGCLAPTDAEGDAERDPCTPRYRFSGEERDALAAGLAAAARASGARAPLDELRRAVSDLGCLACHSLDGSGGIPPSIGVYFQPEDERTDLGDEGRLPPDLSGVGAKLRVACMEKVLRGDARARPYLAVRMPEFSKRRVGDLAELFARCEGVRPEQPRSASEEIGVAPIASEELVLAGRALVGRDQLGCMSCHVFSDFPPTGSPGLAITDFHERLRFDWFLRFMQNTQRFKPGSRMPDFGTGGVSSLVDVLGGDMEAQARALWAYFALGPAMPAPEDVGDEDGLVVLVRDRPIVHRAFLRDVGARGIAIGNPSGVHFAFDAEDVRLVYAWTGAFLDASGSWTGRGGTELEGQGPILWRAPAGPALLVVDAASAADGPSAWPTEGGRAAGLAFRGHRFEADGTVVLSWRSAALEIEERLAGALLPELLIERRFDVTGVRESEILWVNAGAGASHLRDLVACEVRSSKTVGDGTWHAVAPQGGAATLSFRLEVSP